MKEKIVEEKAITITSLAVTIIILILLAGVTIATLTRRKWHTSKSNQCEKHNRRIRARRKNKTTSNGKL